MGQRVDLYRATVAFTQLSYTPMCSLYLQVCQRPASVAVPQLNRGSFAGREGSAISVKRKRIKLEID